MLARAAIGDEDGCSFQGRSLHPAIRNCRAMALQPRCPGEGAGAISGTRIRRGDAFDS
jgi:hypothetical protein